MRFLLCLTVFGFLSFTSLSQNTFDFDYTLNSEAFGKERKFYVHVPELYYEKEDISFGVVYVLDAQAPAFYNNAKSIIDYLVWSYQVMPLIVVGIYSDDRGPEFIPIDKMNPENGGTSHILQNHIRNEVFPFIREKFRVNSFRALIGHSRGGAFIASTLFGEQRDMFNAYLAISPSMGYLKGQILNDVAENIEKKPKYDAFLYASYGSVGSIEQNNETYVHYLDSLWNRYPNPNMHWISKKFEGTSHWGVVAPSVADGILEMNRAYQVDQFLVEKFVKQSDNNLSKQMEEYYSAQQEKLGWTSPLNASDLRYYGTQLSENEKYLPALELLGMAMEKDPFNINTYFNMAWAYRELNRMEEAKAMYLRGKEMLQQNESNKDKVYIDKWLGRIQKQLDEIER